MSEFISDERREIVRSILKQAQLDVAVALENLDTYDKSHFMAIERAAGGLVSFLPESALDGGAH
jgi:hypothetical protein